MKKYVSKILIFISPVIIAVVFIIIVDPYNFVNVSHVISDKNKISVFKRSDEASPRGTILWKALRFKRKPVENIIIGDSQGNAIQESMIEECTGMDYFNFCSPGSSYETMFDSFWFCIDQIKPKRVYFQVGFMNFNKNRSYNIFNFAQDYFDKPYLYFTNKKILVDSYYNLAYQITNDSNLVTKPDIFYDVNWQNDLSEYYLEMFFGKYEYPVQFMDEFEKIADYCNTNNIELNFIILPVYKRVKEYLAERDLMVYNVRFKEELEKFGHVIDFSDYDAISTRRNYFYDYFHPREPIIDTLVREIWSPSGMSNRQRTHGS